MLFQALRITYIGCYFVGFFTFVKGWFIWSVSTSQDQKASLFLVALYLTNLLYACFLYYLLKKVKVYLFCCN